MKNKQIQNVVFNDDDFRKASYSRGSRKRCVLVARKQGVTAVRDSKDPSKTTLRFTSAEWTAFTQGIKAGEFDS